MTLNIPTTMELARWWWILVIRGLAGIAFGVLAFLAPGVGDRAARRLLRGVGPHRRRRIADHRHSR